MGFSGMTTFTSIRGHNSVSVFQTAHTIAATPGRLGDTQLSSGWRRDLIKRKRERLHIWINLWRAFHIQVTAFLFPVIRKLDQTRGQWISSHMRVLDVVRAYRAWAWWAQG